ncbi:type IV pilus biogenesis protein PilM [Marinimicrobium alkaliphilum]|uniref:MSHA biogenesis protein MshI n=1 Tax=Marinimicrobium alkaliphilum TaxID=2202654 RepID=UPI000DB901F3|nr:MSHA biogenesis protein MshI [Marinimicrobium alkaliphilum]
MGLFRQSKKNSGLLGVKFSAEGVAYALVDHRPGSLPTLSHCEFLPAESPAEAVELLRNRLAVRGLSHQPCNLVLAPGSYKLLLVEAPKVPDSELREALRWRVRDQVDFPVTDAVLDVFLLPEDSVRAGSARMAYVAVSERRVIEELVDQAKAANLKLQSIDIAELALRNLIHTCTDTQRGVALVRVIAGAGSVQIVRSGELYLSRQFALSYNGGLLDDLPEDALVLEVQRSLDYFERQMRQPPPGQLLICGENLSADKLTDSLRAALPVAPGLLDMHAGMVLADDIVEHTLSLSRVAVGGALRHSVMAKEG